MPNIKIYPYQYFRYFGAPKYAGIVKPAGLPTCLLKLPQLWVPVTIKLFTYKTGLILYPETN